MVINMRQGINCYFQDTDNIYSLELCDDQSTYIGEIYLMCENKHILKYTRNRDKTLDPDSISAYFSEYKIYFPHFLSHTPEDVLVHFEYVRNFITTEYWEGAAYSIRVLLEKLIYDNYGPYFFGSKPKLSSKADKSELEEISKKIDHVGFNRLLGILEDEKIKDDIKQGIYKKLKDDNLSLAKAVIAKIDSDPTNSIYFPPEDYKNFQKQYSMLSAGLHPRTPIDLSQAEKALEIILKGYEDYFNKNNSWGVLYE